MQINYHFNRMCYSFMRLLLIVLLYLAAMPVFADSSLPAPVDRALKAFDVALEQRQEKIDSVNLRIDSLRHELSSPGIHYDEEIVILERLVTSFRHIQVDSFWHYSERAIALARENNDSLRAVRIYLNQIDVMPLRGYVHEAIMRIDSVGDMHLDDDLKRTFFRNARSAFLCITSLYSPRALDEKYFNKYLAYNDSLLAVTPQDEPEYRLFLGCHYLGAGQLSLAMTTLSDYLETIDMDNMYFGDTASNLSVAQFMRGRWEMWLYFMTLNAHFEAHNAIIDGEAMRQIGARLYERGDVKRAYSYMLRSQEDIAASGAYIRSVHVAGAFPVVDSAYRIQREKYTRILWAISACLILICFLVFVIMRNKVRELRRLSELKAKLVKANVVRETYIAEFLSLCSVYMDKLEEFNRTVSRKIMAGQIEDLYNMVKSGRFIEEQSKLFYDVFDNAFINIYPDFISDVNCLLIEDKKFVLSDPKKLTHELRILAFMRLGLEDSAQMARFLGLSLNTVYTYRNKLKSRAKNRETFEQDILNIGGIE